MFVEGSLIFWKSKLCRYLLFQDCLEGVKLVCCKGFWLKQDWKTNFKVTIIVIRALIFFLWKGTWEFCDWLKQEKKRLFPSMLLRYLTIICLYTVLLKSIYFFFLGLQWRWWIEVVENNTPNTCMKNKLKSINYTVIWHKLAHNPVKSYCFYWKYAVSPFTYLTVFLGLLNDLLLHLCGMFLLLERNFVHWTSVVFLFVTITQSKKSRFLL